MLLFVDQSSAHNAYASNALNARKMNVSPGGKQPVMHDTMIPLNNPNPALQGKHQSMIFDHTHPKHPNEPKGMEVVLKERGLWSLLVDRAGGKRPLGRCRVCKATAAEREKILAEAQAVIDDNPDIFGSIGEHNRNYLYGIIDLIISSQIMLLRSRTMNHSTRLSPTRWGIGSVAWRNAWLQRRIFKPRSLSCSWWLKRLATCASSSQNSTASLTQSKCIGDMQSKVS